MNELRRETQQKNNAEQKDKSIIPEVVGGLVAGAITSVMGAVQSRYAHLTNHGLDPTSSRKSIIKAGETSNHWFHAQKNELQSSFDKAMSDCDADIPKIITGAVIATVVVGGAIYWFRHKNTASQVDAAEHQGTVTDQKQQDKKIESQHML
jgi:hypothetical protein